MCIRDRLIVNLAGTPDTLGKDGAASPGSLEIHREPLPIGLEEVDADQRGQLEGRAQGDAGVTVLDPVERPDADPCTFGELGLGPAPLAAPHADLLAERAG